MNKKKLLTSVVALGTAAVLALGGTFAWQSISQTALNEGADVVNPGGRLHDDFNGENKDIYVENFADEPIFARIQLQEFLKFEVSRNDPIYVRGGEKDDGDPEYDTYIFDETNKNEDGTFRAGINEDTDDTMSPYFSWTVGGSTVYMPTFNKNKDSLVADVNGTYALGVDGTRYADYRTYEDGYESTGDDDYKYALYDYDSNTADELYEWELENWHWSNELQKSFMKYGNANGLSENLSEETFASANELNGTSIKAVEETHTAKETAACTGLISMADWLAMVDDAGGYDADTHGSYWVYDTDGWVYWSAPIAADSATGLLLDGIKLNNKLDDTWDYQIQVKGQFITADDAGKVDNTGFYNDLEGAVPTADAEKLLALIGVEGLLPAEELVTPDATITLTSTGDSESVQVGSTVRVLVDGKYDPTAGLGEKNMVYATDAVIYFVENTRKSGNGYTYYNLYNSQFTQDETTRLAGCELYVNTNTGKILLTVGSGLNTGTIYNFNFYYEDDPIVDDGRYYAKLSVTLPTTEENTGM